MHPINIALETQFITSTAAGRAMITHRPGVILSLTATPGGIGYANVGGFGPACNGVEGFSRNLASELGPYGIRVVNIRSAGSPDSRPFKEALETGGDEVKGYILVFNLICVNIQIKLNIYVYLLFNFNW